MTPSDWAAFALAILSIHGIYIAALRWFLNTEVRKALRDEVQDIVREEIAIVRHELTNNGGSSTKDKIDFIYDQMKIKKRKNVTKR